MKCPNCYREIPSDSKFCPDCGKRIEVRSNTNYSSKNNSSDAEIQRLKRLLAEKERVISSQRQTIETNSSNLQRFKKELDEKDCIIKTQKHAIENEIPKYVTDRLMFFDGVFATYNGYLLKGKRQGKGILDFEYQNKSWHSFRYTCEWVNDEPINGVKEWWTLDGKKKTTKICNGIYEPINW